ncbi:MAG TPA: trigger factor [Myxococcota bacterium]|nr:trigger factor [Myxococcota bacterium]
MAEPSIPFELNTSEPSAVERTLEVEIPAGEVAKAFDRVLRDLGKHARVRGFRPGKAPRSVILKLYGGTVAEEVERWLVGRTLEQAVERSGVAPVVEPTIDAPPPVEGEAFTYRVGTEVKPEIELGEVTGLPAKRPAPRVDDEAVDRELEALRERSAVMVEAPEETGATSGHFVTIDFVGRIDGKPFDGGSAQGHELEIGSGRFVPGFEEQLEGAKAGDDVTVEIRFPDDYGNAELAGKAATFDVHVVTIRRRDVPELDDEFAKDLDEAFETLADLRARVRADLEKNAERRAQGELERSVVDALIERTPFELGPGLVDRQLQNRLAGAHQQLEASIPHERLHEQLARWREEWRPQAEREVRETLLLEAVAKAQGLEVDDAEIDAHLAEVAGEQGGPDAAQLRKLYEERELIEGLRAQLLDRKALAWLCDEAKVEEVSDS